jgi:hypothetical protein
MVERPGIGRASLRLGLRFARPLVVLGAAGCGSAGQAPIGAGAPALATLAPDGGPAPVVLIALDGFHDDYLERVPTPNLDRIVERGVRARGLAPVFPAKTYPTLYSLVTGLHPENHGLVDNTFFDTELDTWFVSSQARSQGRWFEGEPTWITAQREGVPTAAVRWVGADARIHGERPALWRPTDTPFPQEARVDSALTWLALPPERRPALVLLHLSGADRAGHDHGPGSPQVDEAVRQSDRLVGRILDGLDELGLGRDAHVVIVSDHGMAWSGGSPDMGLDDHIGLSGIRVVSAGPYTTIDFHGDEERRLATRDTLAAALPNARVYLREEMPERFRIGDHHRWPDMFVLADEGYRVGRRTHLATYPLGVHGYDPELPSMHGIFLARGPRFREGVRIPDFHSVDVQPLLVHLLGLQSAPAVDGSLESLRPALR